MRSDIPIPHWLKQKSADCSARETQNSGKMIPAIVVGTMVSYFGLMALHAAKPTHENTVAAQAPVQYSPDRAPAYTAPEEKKSPPLGRLTDTNLALMEPHLRTVHQHIAEGNSSGACDESANNKFSLKRMTLPSRYAETLCYAEASRELFGKLNDRQYLELAAYYYRRCLFLIDGQLQGQFKKPKGGDDEIRDRQKSVYIALDSIEQSERF